MEALSKQPKWIVPVCDIKDISHKDFNLLPKDFQKSIREQLQSNMYRKSLQESSKTRIEKKSSQRPKSKRIASRSMNREVLSSEDDERCVGSIYTRKNTSENKVRCISPKHEEKTNYEEPDNEIGDYERMILKNKSDKMAFLQSLKMDELTAPFKKKKAKPIKGIKIKKREFDSPPQPLRKSSRLAKVQPPSVDALVDDTFVTLPKFRCVKMEKPFHMTFEEALIDEALSDVFAREMSYLSEKKFGTKMTYNSKIFKSMKLNEQQIAKVVMDRISAMAIHPSATKILVGTGSTCGQIGLWDVESVSEHDGVYILQPHGRYVSCLAFNPHNYSQLYTSSYDGTFRCGDLQKMVFSEVYYSVDDVPCTGFDFVSSSTFLVSQRDGTVAIVDSRAKGNHSLKKHRSHYKGSAKCVHTHPVEKYYFIVAGSNGIVSLWDLRNLQENPIVNLKHNKTVSSAYFSPISGNHILTTSADDTVRIFDSKTLNDDIKLQVTIPHNNYVTRFLTNFGASWLPNAEDYFCIGSMLNPRRIEVFNVEGNNVYNFESENLNSITSLNVFHPNRPALCGGNSSGKVFAFIGS